MRQTLTTDADHASLVRDGYVKLSLLDADAMDAMREAFWSLRPADGFDPPGGLPTNPMTYHCTFLDVDAAYKRAFDDLVRLWFAPLIEALFTDYTLLIGNAYVKQPGRGTFEVHQNWNLTDRLEDISVTIWLPLQPCDATNGTLMVVPGSHKLTRDVSYPKGPFYFSDFEATLRADYFEPVPVELGEAVLFDDSLIHGSDINRSGAPRAALQVEAIPAESSPVVYFPKDDDTFDLLSAPREFYLGTDQSEIDRWPELFPSIGTSANANRSVSRDEFDGLLADGPAVRQRLWGFDAA